MASTSICSRSRPASRSAPSIIPNARVPPGPVSTTSLATNEASPARWRTTATLLCPDENSSAKIVINNPPFSLTDDFNFRFYDFAICHLPSAIFQPFRPFNHRHAIRLQEFLQPGGHNLPARFRSEERRVGKECRRG